MDFISSISFPNEPLISWTFLSHFCHHFWVGAEKHHQTHPKVMIKMIKKCTTDQRFIWKRNTTGSTIRNWDKVKTWLDRMFWQIYQKIMLSGFLSSGSLCLIHYLNFFDLTQSQRPPTEKVLKVNMSFHDSVRKKYFSKHQNKVIWSSNYWIQEPGRLWSYFPGLRNLSSLIDLSSLCNLTGLNSL